MIAGQLLCTVHADAPGELADALNYSATNGDFMAIHRYGDFMAIHRK
jgi:hypothetical protein